MTRLVDRAAGALAKLDSRRKFLSRTAMVGTAMAIGPTNYVLRPQSAYAAVCNCSGSNCDCGALCCDGYTEFCCTMYGKNTCPPGTTVAGWWKADGSGFCGSGPRYYYDCNAACNGCGCGSNGVCDGSCSGTKCGCAHGDCNNRKAGCTKFRYGQCNNNIRCVGPIVCRVITCTAPWDLFPDECNTSTATDNNTRFHNKPCLQGGPSGRVLSATKASGGRIRVQGWAVDPDTAAAIQVHVYVDDKYVKGATANIARPELATTHPDFGINHGFDVSVPVSDGSHRVCVYGINRSGGGGNALLGCRTVKVGGPVFGYLDTVAAASGGVRVKGWAIDPDTSAPITIRAYIDGKWAAGFKADVPRPDVARAHPGYGTEHGFDRVIPAGRGRHTVCLYAINDNGTGPHLPLGCRTVTVGGGSSQPSPKPPSGGRTPFGYLEQASVSGDSVRVRGWTIDPDTSNPVTIRVYLNGKWLAGFPADVRRKDVARVHPGYGDRHGFDKKIRIPRGRHQLKVYAINNSGSPNTLLGARTVSR